MTSSTWFQRSVQVKDLGDQRKEDLKEKPSPQQRHPSNTDKASYTMNLSFGNHLFLSSTTFTRVKIHGFLRAAHFPLMEQGIAFVSFLLGQEWKLSLSLDQSIVCLSLYFAWFSCQWTRRSALGLISLISEVNMKSELNRYWESVFRDESSKFGFRIEKEISKAQLELNLF